MDNEYKTEIWNLVEFFPVNHHYWIAANSCTSRCIRCIDQQMHSMHSMLSIHCDDIATQRLMLEDRSSQDLMLSCQKLKQE